MRASTARPASTSTWASAEPTEHQDEIGLFVQDSWRLRPNLTVNAGLRWQVAFPFQADDERVFDEHDGRPLRRLRAWRRARRPRVQPVQPRRLQLRAAACRSTSCTTAGSPGLQDRVRQLRAERRRRVAAERAERLAAHAPRRSRRRRRSAPATAWPTTATASASTRDVYNANPGNTIIDEPHGDERAVPAGARRASPGRCCLREPERLGPSPGIPAAPVYPMAINFNSGVNLFHPNFRTPFARSYSVGLQRAISRLMAVEVRYVGTRLVDGTTTENWNEVNWTTQRIPRRVQARAAEPAGRTSGAGLRPAGRPACSFAYSGPGTGTSPLPIYLANFNGAAASAGRRRGALHGHELDEHGAARPSWPRAIRTRAARRTRSSRPRRSAPTWPPPAMPRNFFVLNPDVEQRRTSRPTATPRSTTRCRSTCAARCRAGWRWTPTTRSRRATASTLDTLRAPRTLVQSTDGVPHALKMTAIYELPFGRGKRFGADVSTLARRARSAAGR